MKHIANVLAVGLCSLVISCLMISCPIPMPTPALTLCSSNKECPDGYGCDADQGFCYQTAKAESRDAGPEDAAPVCLPACDDGDICNGLEICSELAECVSSPAQIDGTPCGENRQCRDHGCLDLIDRCAVQLAVGNSHACIRQLDNTVLCWGANLHGQLGTADNLPRHTPTEVDLDNVVEIAAGGDSTCARTLDNKLWCWGAGDQGQLGTGEREDSNRPAEVFTQGYIFNQVAVGGAHACARRSDDTLWCWGRNVEKQLGNAQNSSTVPKRVSGLSNIRHIALGAKHSCAIITDGSAQCWGNNHRGQLGTSSHREQVAAPTRVSLLNNIVALKTGENHTCARTRDGFAWCWGAGNFGQLGADVGASAVPLQVASVASIVDIAVGDNHTCAGIAGGSLWCWGDNGEGQLGNNSRAGGSESVSVILPSNSIKVVAGGNNTCSQTGDGTILCWGSDGLWPGAGNVPVARQIPTLSSCP